jgi:hypothetical protein
MREEQHYREAEKAAAKAAELLGQADSQAAAVWATLAQAHATLALAAATADTRNWRWREAAGTGSIARPQPQPPQDQPLQAPFILR